ncbi:MAG: A24 family peptidase [Eubacterium sp.]|nr:A24 family peptidase [Eubacterium sp.]
MTAFDLYNLVIYIAFLGVLWQVAKEDMKTMLISNRHHLMILLLALMQIPVSGEISGIDRILGAFAVSLPSFLYNVILPGSIGGGDVKLVFAAGFLLGSHRIVEAACLGFIAAGVYGGLQLVRGKMKREDHFAFGPFLCGAMAISVLDCIGKILFGG